MEIAHYDVTHICIVNTADEMSFLGEDFRKQLRAIKQSAALFDLFFPVHSPVLEILKQEPIWGIFTKHPVDLLKQAEREIIRDCGEKCIRFFRELVENFRPADFRPRDSSALKVAELGEILAMLLHGHVTGSEATR